MNGEQTFDAAAGIGKLIADNYAAERQAKKDRRNAAARRRYRARPRPARQRASGPGAEPDLVEVGCRCFVMAPCTFCESGGEEGEAE